MSISPCQTLKSLNKTVQSSARLETHSAPRETAQRTPIAVAMRQTEPVPTVPEAVGADPVTSDACAGVDTAGGLEAATRPPTPLSAAGKDGVLPAARPIHQRSLTAALLCRWVPGYLG